MCAAVMEMGADELISCAFSCGRRLGLNGLASRQFGIGPAFLALSIDLKLISLSFDVVGFKAAALHLKDQR